ncbi:hypothetical protein RRF57_009763 [Xylaria bambusicola]|uniref:Uncharacterized protein n=1 Tax=Xylaria bambusicola TaxID=326684 RepID=A0AAN7UZW1_9PEZI
MGKIFPDLRIATTADTESKGISGSAMQRQLTTVDRLRVFRNMTSLRSGITMRLEKTLEGTHSVAMHCLGAVDNGKGDLRIAKVYVVGTSCQEDSCLPKPDSSNLWIKSQ